MSIAVARTEAERANHVTSSDPASLLPDVMSELRRSREQYIGVRSCGRPAHEVADRLGVGRPVGEEVLAAHPGERESAPGWVQFAGCVVDSRENRRCFDCGHGWTSE